MEPVAGRWRWPLLALWAFAVMLAQAALLPRAAMAQSANQIFEQGLNAFDQSDFGRAAGLFKQACDAGVPNACSNLAVLYMTGRGVEAEPARGIAMFDAACRLGSAEGCDNAKTARSRAAAAAARAAAKPVVKASTVAGSVQACLDGSQGDCMRAGEAYSFGKGVAKDFVAARPMVERACLGGHAVSCYYAGSNFEIDDGGPPDLVKAGLYYEKACEGRVVRSGCGNLGRFYELAENFELSAVAYGKVCSDEEIEYCRKQGQVLHKMGRIAEALPLLERACAADNGGACSLLGYVQADMEDWANANASYAKACRLGETEQCAYSKQLARDFAAREAWHAERGAERAEVAKLIQSGNTARAADYAVYQLRSGPLASEVVQSAMRSNKMGAFNTQTLYVLASWFRSGPVSGAVNAELRARGTGLEGTFGKGTNAPGMAEARWKAQNGDSASYSNYRPSQSSTPKPATLSSADAASQTRNRYRTAHCQMPSSPKNSSVCR
jgi:TPR repeat protein